MTLPTPITAESADDGWIAWAGGECPVSEPNDTMIEVRLRKGSVNSAAAFLYRWNHSPARNKLAHRHDIIAYRVVQP